VAIKVQNPASKLKDKLAYAIIWILTADAVGDHVDAGFASVEPAAVRFELGEKGILGIAGVWTEH
jgi:hypothetical protein